MGTEDNKALMRPFVEVARNERDADKVAEFFARPCWRGC
jgi:hypothetical protein